jgi:hypothetical protein
MKARSTQYDRHPQHRHNNFTTINVLHNSFTAVNVLHNSFTAVNVLHNSFTAVNVLTAAAGARQRVRHRRGYFHYACEWAPLHLSQSAGAVKRIH